MKIIARVRLVSAPSSFLLTVKGGFPDIYILNVIIYDKAIILSIVYFITKTRLFQIY